MSKQLRIWLFVLIGTLLASSSLLAEGVITMTTSKAVGEKISLGIEANGNVTIEGIKEVPRTGDIRVDYTLTSQTIIIRGDVTMLNCDQERLTSLDISGCTALTMLNCSGNYLTSLDLSGCTALTELKCYNIRLTSLNVSGCTALEKLRYSYNQLTSLKAVGCTSLTSLQCSNNRLTSLDVSSCTALTKLYCFYNQLTSLDVSGCTALTTLTCSSNQLTSLGLSDCPQLNFVDCSVNQIKGKAMTQLVASLPTYNSGNERESGYFIIVSNLAPEGNVCSKADVATARAKNWNSFKKVNGGKLLPYEGEDDNLQVGNGVITMTTTKAVGKTIALAIQADGGVTIEGVKAFLQPDGCIAYYTLTSQTVTIRGDVTALTCYYNQLINLDVSGCTALTMLECYDNQLTSLDLSGCTALTELRCEGSQLTSLNVSGCTALEKLRYSYNQLTSLKAVGCTSLTSLQCSNNRLTSLDVSGCTALTTLVCDNNQLTSLDVSQNTALTTLNCSNNRLTSLDVSGCTALTRLNCFYNQLTSLDVSKNTALRSLYCGDNQLTSLDVSDCTSLTSLNCSKNQLTSLDASACTALRSLFCSWTQLTSLNVLGCTALTDLSCEGSQLTSLDVSGCTALRRLQCYKNQLTSLDVSGCTDLTGLHCYENQLTSLNVSSCTALSGLYCYENQLTSLNVSGCTDLTTLLCYNNQLTSLNASGCTALATFECYNNQLTSLDVSGCTALTELSCGSNQLTSLDVSKNTSLTKLDCGWNQLTSLDLSNHARLRVLDCSNNLLRKIDLSGCTNIYLLICHKNQIKAPEMTSLVNSLPDLQGKGVGFFRVFYDGSGEGNVCFATHVAIAKAKNWKILFTRDPYDNYWHDYTGADNPIFTVTSSSTSGGAISFTGADNLNAVPYGTELTVIATPAEGYELTGLTANDRNILDTKKVVVDEDLLIKAIFRKKTFAVALSSNEHGTISIAESVDLDAVPYGTTLTVIATPAEGYELTELTANDSNILDTKQVVVSEDLLIKATFRRKTFAVTLTSNEHGTISIVEPVDLDAVTYGTTLTVKATGKNAQCELTALTANGEDILATQSFVVKGATEVKATFVDHTGVETTVTQQTQLYPNPATDYVIVEGVVPASEVTLHSMTGERLYAGRADSRGTLRIDLTPYADGVYLVCVADETYRVVVRH